MITEQWAAIPGFVGHYEVSERGVIRSLTRTVTSSHDWTRTQSGQVIAPYPGSQGHLQVDLYLDGVRTRLGVHRAVLLAFQGEPAPEQTEARHVNGNPSDNRIENLMWGTSSDNKFDSVRHGTHAEAAKTHCPQGHPYSAANTLISGGGRKCRICVRAVNARYRARQRAFKVSQS